MGIWDEVTEIEEMNDLYKRIDSLQKRCVEAEEVSLRICTQFHGFKTTLEKEAKYIYDDQKLFPNLEQHNNLVNFNIFTNLYRRIEYVEQLYLSLYEESKEDFKERKNPWLDVLSQLKHMIQSLKESYNVCLDVIQRLVERHSAVYILCEAVPKALFLDQSYIEKYYFSTH